MLLAEEEEDEPDGEGSGGVGVGGLRADPEGDVVVLVGAELLGVDPLEDGGGGAEGAAGAEGGAFELEPEGEVPLGPLGEAGGVLLEPLGVAAGGSVVPEEDGVDDAADGVEVEEEGSSFLPLFPVGTAGAEEGGVLFPAFLFPAGGTLMSSFFGACRRTKAPKRPMSDFLGASSESLDGGATALSSGVGGTSGVETRAG